MEAVGVGLPADVGGNAVEEEIAHGVGNEVQIVVAREVRQLSVEAVDRALQRQHAVLGLLILPLIEFRRIESGHPKRAGQHGRRVKDVRDLEIGVIRAGDQAQARIRIDEGR